MNVCQRNVACFGQVECMFDKIKDIFQGFGSLNFSCLVLSLSLGRETSEL